MKTWHISLLMLLATACSGPDYKFDPSPTPEWTGQPPAAMGAARLQAVGRAPATLQLQRDLELATRDAREQVALLFESKVKAETSDWTLEVSTGKGSRSISSVSRDVRVATNVKVEATKVGATYRDSDTRTQYVRLEVDRPRWAGQVRTRTDEAFAKIGTALKTAGAELSKGKPFAAFKKTNEGYKVAAMVEPDTIVLSLLDADSKAQPTLRRNKALLDRLSRRLRDESCFTIVVEGPAATEVKGRIETFLAEYGFSTSNPSCKHRVTVQANVGVRPDRTEKVANRTEHIYGATGKLAMVEAGAPAIDVRLSKGAHEARGASAEEAKKKAIDLAAKTLVRKFRSAFRQAFDS